MIGLQGKKWLDRSRFYRIEFCLLAVGKTKNDLLVVLLDHLIINEKESEGLWWSTATRNRERKKMRKREKPYKR